MPPPDRSNDPRPGVSDKVLTVCYRRALAAFKLDATQLPRAAFIETLTASIAHRFADSTPTDTSVRRYLDSLRLPNLALACVCRYGDERAWERFVQELRPTLYRAGRAIAGQDVAGRDLVDSIWAELYGVGRGGSVSNEPRSIFRYYHGRSTLATWLRAVLAQRHVDHIRETRRMVPTETRELERALPTSGRSMPGTSCKPRRTRRSKNERTDARCSLVAQDTDGKCTWTRRIDPTRSQTPSSPRDYSAPTEGRAARTQRSWPASTRAISNRTRQSAGSRMSPTVSAVRRPSGR